MKRVEAVTKIDYPKYKKFYQFSQFRGKRYKWGPFILYGSTIIMIFLAIGVSLFPTPPIVWLPAYVLACSLTIFALSNLFLPKLQFKGLAYQLKIPQHFLFLEDRMEISTHAGDSVLEYAEIDKVYETEDTFYIYITKRQAIIVAKQDFTQGHSGILRKQFEKKLGKKFVRCYRA